MIDMPGRAADKEKAFHLRVKAPAADSKRVGQVVPSKALVLERLLERSVYGGGGVVISPRWASSPLHAPGLTNGPPQNPQHLSQPAQSAPRH